MILIPSLNHQIPFCDSCQFADIASPFDIYCKNIEIAKYSPYYGRKLSQGTIEFLKVCGCASHSVFNKLKGFHDIEEFYKDKSTTPSCFQNPKECPFIENADTICSWFSKCNGD